MSQMSHYWVLLWAMGLLTLLENIAEVPDWQLAKMGKLSSIFSDKTDHICHAQYSNYIAATHNITHSPCTSTCTPYPALPTPLHSTTLLCTQLTQGMVGKMERWCENIVSFPSSLLGFWGFHLYMCLSESFFVCIYICITVLNVSTYIRNFLFCNLHSSSCLWCIWLYRSVIRQVFLTSLLSSL